MKARIIFFLFFLSSSFAFSQDNVFEVISNSAEHEIFTELIELSGYDQLLKGNAYYSVFAPDDLAFTTAFSQEGLDSLKLNIDGALNRMILNHIVPDTVALEFGSGPHLPLSGNHLILFICGAGDFLIVGGAIDNPIPMIKYATNPADLYQEAANGKVLWTSNNLIHPSCENWDDVLYDSNYLLYWAIQETNLEASLGPSQRVLTFLGPSESEANSYILDNGGFAMTTFLDSFIRRHVVVGSFPFQNINDGMMVENLLGETLEFSVENDSFFVNDNYIRRFNVSKKAVCLSLDSFLLEPEVLIVGEPDDTQFLVTEVSNLEKEELNKLRLFPNPGVDFVELRRSKTAPDALVTIFNIYGQVVLKEKISGTASKLNINNLQAGTYFVHYNSRSFSKMFSLSKLK